MNRILLACLLGAACKGPGDDTSVDTADPFASVGGVALGVLGSGLVLQNNAGDLGGTGQAPRAEVSN